MKFTMDETLTRTLREAYCGEPRICFGNLFSSTFAGEMVIKGTNLRRGEYGEDAVELSGFLSLDKNKMHLYEGFVHNECELGTEYEYDISDNKTMCVFYNKNVPFEEFVNYLAIVIAHHEGYSIC